MLQLVVLLAGTLSSLFVGWFVFTRNPKGYINQLFGLLTMSFIALTIFNSLTLSVTPHLLTYMRLVIFSTSMAVTVLLFIVIEIRNPNRTKKLSPWLLYGVLGSSTLVAVLEMTPSVFTSLSSDSLNPTPVPGFGIAFFIIHFIALIGATVAIVFNGALYAHTRKMRGQFRTMQIGIAPILILAPITSVVLPIFLHLTFFVLFSPLYLVFFLVATAYAIVRHGLFDIRLVVIRTTAYVLSLAALSLIYFLTAYLASITFFKNGITTGISFSPINVILALILAFIFQPIKQFFDKVTDKVFFRDRYDSDTFISRLGQVLTSTTDLQDLLVESSIEIQQTLKASHATFIVFKEDEYGFVSGSSKESIQYDRDAIYQLKRYIAQTKNLVVVDQEADTPQLSGPDHQVLALLRKKRVVLMLPLVRNKQPIGALFLGEHRSSQYTKRDARVLKAISNELIIAVQNARNVQELQDLNRSLKQRIEEATKELRTSNAKLKKLDASKDEFLSMASHQLRTPLTSVKGYLSMVLEGDAGKISLDQQKLLEQAFESSQRMVYLIGDFLNVSRIQTGKFVIELSDMDLNKVVQEEVQQLIDTARARNNIRIQFDPPATPIILRADDNKLRQVMMNFMDNAIYYGKRDGHIDVQLYKNKDSVIFKVVDDGIGVPKEAQKKLFTKFFRAGNARTQRPDGTGIGIYMAQKVVVALGGTVIFESVEGKGSTFGFKLPLKNSADQFDQEPGND
jgi:signal transduction histidine kinase